MKIRLKRTSEVTSSFIELARVIERYSALNPTESIDIAKQVMYADESSHELFVEVYADTNVDNLQKELVEEGVELTVI